jgi:hypothetical protein
MRLTRFCADEARIQIADREEMNIDRSIHKRECQLSVESKSIPMQGSFETHAVQFAQGENCVQIERNAETHNMRNSQSSES